MPKKRGSKPAINAKELERLQEKIIENLISLQKVHTSLAEKFDKLSMQISNLLSLFEMTARSLSEHPAVAVSEKDKEFLGKLDKMLEQNKLIAKGLTLVEERVREKVYGQGEENQQQRQNPPQNIPQRAEMQVPQPLPSAPPSEEFRPSIASRPLKRF